MSWATKEEEVNMSVEPIHIKLETVGEPPSSFPVVLKKIMEMPPPNILDGDDGKRKPLAVQKERFCEKRLFKLKKKKNGEKHENTVFLQMRFPVSAS